MTKFTFRGLDDLLASIRGLPQALAAGTQPTVTKTAERMANALRNELPIHAEQGSPRRKAPGGLRRGVKVKVFDDPRVAKAEVVNTAPHAHLIEYGWTAKGKANRKVEGRYTVSRMAPQFRRQMLSELVPLVDEICQREIE